MPEGVHEANRTALVTGASSGIGRALAGLFARDGYDLVLVARDAARLAEVAGELQARYGAAVRVLRKDLSDPGAPGEIFRELVGAGVAIDVLVNNAGFNVYGRFAETDAASELRMLQVHVMALTHLTKLFLPGMLERGSGRILNLGSTGSFAPCPNDSVYCATKAYVLSFSEAIAHELEGTGVTVTALCPGPTKTAFAERAGMTDVRLFRSGVASVEEVAEAGYRALVSGRRLVVPGLRHKLSTFAVRFAPRRVVTAMGRSLLTR